MYCYEYYQIFFFHSPRSFVLKTRIKSLNQPCKCVHLKKCIVYRSMCLWNAVICWKNFFHRSDLNILNFSAWISKGNLKTNLQTPCVLCSLLLLRQFMCAFVVQTHRSKNWFFFSFFFFFSLFRPENVFVLIHFFVQTILSHCFFVSHVSCT